MRYENDDGTFIDMSRDGYEYEIKEGFFSGPTLTLCYEGNKVFSQERVEEEWNEHHSTLDKKWGLVVILLQDNASATMDDMVADKIILLLRDNAEISLGAVKAGSIHIGITGNATATAKALYVDDIAVIASNNAEVSAKVAVVHKTAKINIDRNAETNFGVLWAKDLSLLKNQNADLAVSTSINIKKVEVADAWDSTEQPHYGWDEDNIVGFGGNGTIEDLNFRIFLGEHKLSALAMHAATMSAKRQSRGELPGEIIENLKKIKTAP